MGERTEIYLVNDGIYLYSHWDRLSELKVVLKNALIRGKSRWEDSSYLNRIIFSEMIKKYVEDETGYGISSQNQGDYIIEVDVENQEVDGIGFEEFIK